jgi:hypothetical protein
MREIEIDQRGISIIDQRPEATSPLEPKSSEREGRTRPSAKQMRAALKERPLLRVIKDLLPDIWRVAYCTTFDEYDLKQFEEGELVTPATYWEYLSLAGEDHGERTEELELAIKTLKAILAAKPNPLPHRS